MFSSIPTMLMDSRRRASLKRSSSTKQRTRRLTPTMLRRRVGSRRRGTTWISSRPTPGTTPCARISPRASQCGWRCNIAKVGSPAAGAPGRTHARCGRPAGARSPGARPAPPWAQGYRACRARSPAPRRGVMVFGLAGSVTSLRRSAIAVRPIPACRVGWTPVVAPTAPNVARMPLSARKSRTCSNRFIRLPLLYCAAARASRAACCASRTWSVLICAEIASRRSRALS